MFKEIKIQIIGSMNVFNEDNVIIAGVPITTLITLHNGHDYPNVVDILLKNILIEADTYNYANIYVEFYGNGYNNVLDGITIIKERSGNYTILKYDTNYNSYRFILQNTQMPMSVVQSFAMQFIDSVKSKYKIK